MVMKGAKVGVTATLATTPSSSQERESWATGSPSRTACWSGTRSRSKTRRLHLAKFRTWSSQMTSSRESRSRIHPRRFLSTLVKRGSSIGANATIVCGVTLGEQCFVGAGAVVTKSVPAHALVAGNPARQRGWMCACGEKLPTQLACSCGRRYVLNTAAAGLRPVSAEGK